MGYQGTQELDTSTPSINVLYLLRELALTFTLCNFLSNWSSLSIDAFKPARHLDFIGVEKYLRFKYQRQLDDLLGEHESTLASSQDKLLAEQ